MVDALKLILLFRDIYNITKNKMRTLILFSFLSLFLSLNVIAQTAQDSLEIRQVALDYIESQHLLKPELFDRAAHPRMVKRTFWKSKLSGRDYLRETFKDAMMIVAETYNKSGDKFPKQPMKEVVILDIFDRTASVKLIADDWIDYMHIVKLNGKWQIVNVLWQFKDNSKH